MQSDPSGLEQSFRQLPVDAEILLMEGVGRRVVVSRKTSIVAETASRRLKPQKMRFLSRTRLTVERSNGTIELIRIRTTLRLRFDRLWAELGFEFLFFS